MIRLLRRALEKLGLRRADVRSQAPASLHTTSAGASTHGGPPDSTRETPTSPLSHPLRGKGSQRPDASRVDFREVLRKVGLSESEISEILDASTDSQKRLLLDSLAERRGRRHGGSSSSPIGGR